MKTIILNTYSPAEPEYRSKLTTSAGSLVQIKPNIIALQEVNQPKDALPVAPGQLQESCYVLCRAIGLSVDSPCVSYVVICVDNHAFNPALFLARTGVSYQWIWIPAKAGYGIYDKDLAVLSRSPVLGTNQFYITGIRDYENWETHKILGINTRTEYGDESLYSVHTGWWNDSEEPSEGQWKRVSRDLTPLSGKRLWPMGDFNSPVHVTGRGRGLILVSGWFDTYDLAVSRDLGVTVASTTDRWREQGEMLGMHINYIQTSRRVPVISTKTIHDGIYGPLVSDHSGITTKYQTGQCPRKTGNIQK